jgi:hypothetical protein
LGLRPSNALGGSVEWLADIAGSAREGLSDLSRRLVAQIMDTPPALVKQVAFSPLQALVTARPLHFTRLGLLQTRKLFVAVLDGRFGRASADEDGPISIGGCNQRVYPQVHTDNCLLGPFVIGYFTDESHGAIGHAHFH